MAATELLINGRQHRVEAEPTRTLLSVLRDDLDLTGAKYGCGEGKCGACTVLIDGRAVRSCVTALGDVGAKPITTIEGLERDGQLHPVQEAFLNCGAMQCGYCTPGMILAAVGFLGKTPDPTPQDVIKGLEGSVCRCGTYGRITAAVCQAAQAMKGGAR
jgi:aerobic-type carbon monoxide dehydrogenase small subunit (CoxS/CutS family)